MVKKIEKGDDVTIFWYTLKNLHPHIIRHIGEEKNKEDKDLLTPLNKHSYP